VRSPLRRRRSAIDSSAIQEEEDEDDDYDYDDYDNDVSSEVLNFEVNLSQLSFHLRVRLPHVCSQVTEILNEV
jgi:hypothetical protein